MSIPCGITLLLTGFLARLTISFRTFLSFSPTKVTALKKKEVAFVELADEQYSKYEGQFLTARARAKNHSDYNFSIPVGCVPRDWKPYMLQWQPPGGWSSNEQV